MTETIILTEQQVDNAVSLNKRIIDSGVPNTPNPTGLHIKNRFLIGYLGEMAFGTYLDSHDIDYEHKFIVGRRQNSNEPDFLVGDKKIDVKTSSKKYGNKNILLIWENQFQKEIYDIYVSAVIVDYPVEIELQGWASRQTLEQCPVKQFKLLDRYCEGKYLLPMYSLIEEFML